MIRAEHYTTLPDDARVAVMSRLRSFPWKYFERREEQTPDKDVFRLFSDLQRGAFWHVLSRLDGPARTESRDLISALRTMQDKPVDIEQQRSSAREWAATNFDEHELRDIFEICVGIALTVPFKTSWPGTTRGHSILYHQLFSTPDSIFTQYVDERFRVQLNNGRLWEELPHVGGGVDYGLPAEALEDVLVNHFDDLDPAFGRFGYGLFERNGGKTIQYDLRSLSKQGLRGYRAFVSALASVEPDVRLEPDQLMRLQKVRI